MNTKSKNFKDHEIRGILPDGSIYLKMGVTRLRYNDKLEYESMDHINDNLVRAEKLRDALNKLFGSSPEESE